MLEMYFTASKVFRTSSHEKDHKSESGIAINFHNLRSVTARRSPLRERSRTTVKIKQFRSRKDVHFIML